jgi:hypothetical protein
VSETLDLSIDKNNLDAEWVEQPTLYFHWAKNASDAQHSLDKEKAKFDLIKAELEQSIRAQPNDYGLEKVTESAISATVLVQPEYKAGLSRVNDARHDLAVAQAAVNALEHRKRSLSMLVELWIREYYTADSSPKPRSMEAAEFDKASVRSRGRRRIEAADRERDTDD